MCGGVCGSEGAINSYTQSPDVITRECHRVVTALAASGLLLLLLEYNQSTVTIAINLLARSHRTGSPSPTPERCKAGTIGYVGPSFTYGVLAEPA